jgi:NitT/TauT family transport system substrate-binding protein
MPLWLNTINPTSRPSRTSPKRSHCAAGGARVDAGRHLQMAAEKVFGKGQEHKLDAWTVSLSHPDGQRK